MSTALRNKLAVFRFCIEERTNDATWRRAGSLLKGTDYRFLIQLRNEHENTNSPIIGSSMHSGHLIWGLEILNVCDAAFYSSEAYTGTSYDRGTYAGTCSDRIEPEKSKKFYIYFRWNREGAGSPFRLRPKLTVTFEELMVHPRPSMTLIPA